MIPKQLNNITIEDIQELIVEGRPEGRTIEYMLELPGNSEIEKIIRLLKPVCSFSNTDGGEIIYGISKDAGIPKNIVGINIDNVEQKKLSLLQIIKNGIEPQISGIQIKKIEIANNQIILIIHIPKSQQAPHRVILNSTFYARNATGIYELDVFQIRNAFLLSCSHIQRIHNFHAERSAFLLDKDSSFKIREGARSILHLIPLSSFTTTQILEVSQYQNKHEYLMPHKSENITHHLNFDGMLVADGTPENGYKSYTQFYRSGIVEFVHVHEPRNKERCIYGKFFGLRLLHNFIDALNFLKELGFTPPIYAFLALVGAKGYILEVGLDIQLNSGNPIPFDRNILSLPNIVINTFDIKNEIKALKPLFNIIWNAAGYSSAPNFEENIEFQQEQDKNQLSSESFNLKEIF